jgi:hypothetical protein
MFRLFNRNVSPSTTCIALIRLKKNYHSEPYGIRETTFAGYSYTKEFFSPSYDKVQLPGEADYRRTLYWNPNVQTDENGQAVIEFYNNSTCKSMSISAETVTANGVIGVLK